MQHHADVLDDAGQQPLRRDLRTDLNLVYHSTSWRLPEFVKFIYRAKDELVTPVNASLVFLGSAANDALPAAVFAGQGRDRA